MLDNLDYFIDLYEGRGLTVEQALATEACEIARIRQGERGGLWSKIVVELNAEFYSQLRAKYPNVWSDVRPLGELIIEKLVQELISLTPVVET